MKFNGLSEQEVEKSRTLNGTNAISENETEGFWAKFFGNFDDPIIKILLGALVLNIGCALLGKSSWIEPFGIFFAMILSTGIGAWSEFKNESSFQALQEEASRIIVKVFRDGTIKEIPINDIVCGDYVLLQTGDKVPADGYLVDGSITLDQSALNGESREALKEYKSLSEIEESELSKVDFESSYKTYRGSIVLDGEAVLKVTVVGEKSVYGGILKSLVSNEIMSPLQVKLKKLSKLISIFGYVGGISGAVMYMFSRICIDNGFVSAEMGAYITDLAQLGTDVVQAVILCVTIIVMAVPEGLPMMVNMVLGQNMRKMIKDNVLVRTLQGIETSGSINILFSDKTGTITKGILEAVEITTGNNTQYKKFKEIPGKLKDLIGLAIKENSTAIFNKESDKYVAVGGNSTERAVANFIVDGYNFEEKSDISIVLRDTFSSDKKYSATQIKGNTNLTFYKGAPEKLIEKCTKFVDENGQELDFLTKKNEIEDKVSQLANRAMRVIALAYSHSSLEKGKINNNLVFLGILGIRDDVRNSSVEAIKEAKLAGAQVVMVTGDRQDTAVAIAREAGLIEDGIDIAIQCKTAQEIDEMSEKELRECLPKLRVVSRALPNTKLNLVKCAQSLGMVTGMTGDGVNDAPALKRADVGFAMGDGTEVAKEAGDIILLDNNFNSICKSILYGRTIFKSIRKFLVFQLSINVSTVLAELFFPLFGVESPLSIVQILWINLVMDTLGALAFGGEPALKEYMSEKPIDREADIINKKMYSQIGINGIYMFIMGLFLLKAPIFNQFFDSELALSTAYFSFFIICSVVNGFNIRTEKMNLFDNISLNKGFLSTMAVIAGVQVLMTLIGGAIFRTTPLSLIQWGIVLGLSLVIIPIDLIRKVVEK